MARGRKPKDRVSEQDLVRLMDTAAGAIKIPATLRLRPELVLAMTKELLQLREELFRLQVCETVDRLLAKEQAEG